MNDLNKMNSKIDMLTATIAKLKTAIDAMRETSRSDGERPAGAALSTPNDKYVANRAVDGDNQIVKLMKIECDEVVKKLAEEHHALIDLNDRHDQSIKKIFELERINRRLTQERNALLDNERAYREQIAGLIKHKKVSDIERDADDLSELMARVIKACDEARGDMLKYTARGAVEWFEMYAPKMPRSFEKSKELKRVNYEFMKLESRIATIADEFAGSGPVQSADANLTRIEKECDKRATSHIDACNRADKLDEQLTRVREAAR